MKLFSALLRFAMVALLVSSIAIAVPHPRCMAVGAGVACAVDHESEDAEPVCCCNRGCDGECCEHCCCGEGPEDQDKPLAPPNRSSGDEHQGSFASSGLKVTVLFLDEISNHSIHGRVSLGGASAVPSLQMQHVRIQT